MCIRDRSKLEQTARKELDATAPRRFAVLRPLKVVLQGMPKGGKGFEANNHPKDESLGKRPLSLGGTIFIDRDDFRPELKDDPNFYGLAVGREVGLLGAGVNITVTEAVHDKGGALSHLMATVDLEKANKPKGNLHWVDAATAVKAECRVYDVLFTPEDPEKAAKEAAASASGAGGAAADEADEEDDEEDGGAAVAQAAQPAVARDARGARREVARGGRGAAQPHAEPPRVPVPAHRLLLRRRHVDEQAARLQPHRRPQGGQGEEDALNARAGRARAVVDGAPRGGGTAGAWMSPRKRAQAGQRQVRGAGRVSLSSGRVSVAIVDRASTAIHGYGAARSDWQPSR